MDSNANSNESPARAIGTDRSSSPAATVSLGTNRVSAWFFTRTTARIVNG